MLRLGAAVLGATALTAVPSLSSAQGAPPQGYPPSVTSAPEQTGAPVAAPVTPEATQATLQLLLNKGLITQAEYAAALRGEAPAAPKAKAEDKREPVSAKWEASLYGFAELDAIYDSTESFSELPGNGAIVRPERYGGQNSRATFTVRNSRLGFKLKTPEWHRLVASAVAEMDFLGNQPPTATEAQLFNNATFRVRHYYLKVESPWVDLLAGQYWQLFGWQGTYHPNSVAIQGVPGQVYSRAPQIRLSHTFGKKAPVGFELAVAASRPVQRDADAPDGQFAARLLVNGVKGQHTSGSTGSGVQPLSVGVSGLVRHFQVPDLNTLLGASVPAAPPSNAVTGWGISADALVPAVPTSDRLHGFGVTLVGSFVYGYGINDLYTGLSGGIGLPAVPASGPTDLRVDPGLVGYGGDNVLNAIGVRSFLLGAEIYLPRTRAGQLWLSANFTQLEITNAADFVRDQKNDPTRFFNQSRWADANLFWDVFGPVRLGCEYSWFEQTYLDGAVAHNHRFHAAAFYIF